MFSAIRPWTVLIVVVALFGSVPILKKGQALLSEKERSELTALGPDALGMLAPLVMFALALLAASAPVPAGIVAVAVAAFWAYRVPYRFAKQTWPLPARRSLVAGNALLIAGSLLFVLLNCGMPR